MAEKKKQMQPNRQEAARTERTKPECVTNAASDSGIEERDISIEESTTGNGTVSGQTEQAEAVKQSSPDGGMTGGQRMKAAFGNWFGLLLVIICGVLFSFIIARLSYLANGVSYLLRLIKPVIYGAVIAYLLNPFMKMYQKAILKGMYRKDRRPSKRGVSISRGISITLAMITGLLIIAALIWLLVPQLVTSIATLVNTVPDQAEAYSRKLIAQIQNNHFLANQLQRRMVDLTNTLDEWMQNDLLPWMQSDLLPNVNSVATQFANGVMNVLGVLYNVFIGMIVAVYLLAGKEVFIAQGKKILYGSCGKKQADVILHYARITNNMFSGFISGKIVDSTIIGIICFVAMSILHLPYALLVSVIVGVTNVIPVFGPYIGAVPSALLILLVSPLQSLYFVILIVVIQQLDGNVIGPAILGESTGLTAFWVLFAILIFGGIWGLAGMIVGVPLFAVIYRVLKDYMELRLTRKGMNTSTLAYMNLKEIQTDPTGCSRYIPFSKEEMEDAALQRQNEEKISLATILGGAAAPENVNTGRRRSRKNKKSTGNEG